MPYVMIPVPAELVEEVMQFILRAAARASAQQWDAESIAAVIAEVDEECRSVLALVARTSSIGSELDAVEAAGRLQLGVRETAAIVHELNNFSRETNRPNLITAPSVTERLPDGRLTDKRMLQMDPELAELVLAAEQAQPIDVPRPLGEAPQ